jgi:hypothetical protein
MMSEQVEAEVVYRWYQVSRDVTHEIEFNDDEKFKPTRVWERSLVTPDIRTHLCEVTASAYVDVLEYTAEFEDGVPERANEEWDTLLNYTGPVEGYYIHYADLFDAKSGKPKWQHVEQGEDTEEGAREYAQGNHLI